MKGTGPIVLRLENGYRYYEHDTITSAKAEARRLCETVGGHFVVYVPVALVEPMPRTKETELWTGKEIEDGDRLPF